jgi:hypothetical protein
MARHGNWRYPVPRRSNGFTDPWILMGRPILTGIRRSNEKRVSFAADWSGGSGLRFLLLFLLRRLPFDWLARRRRLDVHFIWIALGRT